MSLRSILYLVLLCIPLAGTAVPAASAERGTAEEAQALVARAIALYDEQGMAAFEVMNRGEDGFRDRDLYIFVIGPDDRTVVHAADANQLGADVMALKDSDGMPFGPAMIAAATPEGAWIDYRWPNPQTGAVESKSSWVVKHDGYIFGCGVYKP